MTKGIQSFALQGPAGTAYSFFLTAVILVNIASFVLSTEPDMDDYRGVCRTQDFGLEASGRIDWNPVRS